MKKLLIIDSSILPPVYLKVVEAKELLRTGKAKGITDAVRQLDISRSTFYKYKDYVFNISEGMIGNKATISFLLDHETGVLSSILQILAEKGANVLTISQDIPINKIANLSITFEMSAMSMDVDRLMNLLKAVRGVVRTELIAME
ncbi:MAG: ACT domain-containing protein [Peptostreptococcaceae bacterium]|nr:ACT domain-containing protein [Peptostreptococcaceae bacterium]